MVNSDLQRILHIKHYCLEIESFLDRIDRDYEKFLDDNMFIRATSMCILQIGENASGLSDAYRKRTAEAVNWRSIRGMRNIMTHNYGIIDNEILWDTITKDIPELLEFCNNELSANPPDQNTPSRKHKEDRDDR
jgi:uncharacterized protein with HEPN domain